MQNQKTTSFSKILANKNNNSVQQVLSTLQQEVTNSNNTTTTTTNPFYIDQTKNNNNNNSLLSNNYQKNLSIGHKSWRSDTNLNSRLILSDCEQQIVNNEYINYEDRLDEEDEDFYDQDLENDLDNSNLEFSDHAGLYEVLENYKNFDFSVQNFQQNLSKYDIYKLKKNYKLTFTKKNIRQMSRLKQDVNGEDSLVYSGNQLKKFNFEDYVNNEESDEGEYYDEDEEEDEGENQANFDPSHSYLDQISKDLLFLNNTGDENQLLDENIMNWSMKLSVHDQFTRRSQSRSPISIQNSNTKKNSAKQLKNFSNFQTQNRLLNTQFQNFNPIKNFQQIKFEQQQQQQQQQQNNKKCASTTSWGKLKNSKSNSSNVGLSSQSIANSNDDSNFSNLNINNESMTFGSKSINSSQTLQSNLSPHLYKLFRNSKANLNSTNLDETTTTTATTTSTSGSDLSFQLNSSLNRQSRKVPNETQNKKTSFSQLRQRSLSSCAITSNPTTTESPKMKKSIGTQHEPQETDKSPTILCMVLDKNNKLNKKDILIAAAKAKAMANQSGVLKIQKTNSGSKRSSSLFNTKHSLPDLTFLTHYSDKKPEVTPSKPSPNLQTVPNDLLKRKTLKSIKRYRQTKQNTEPCAVQIINPPKKIEENSEIIFERRPSLPFNERGKNPINTLNGKQPLKSCLKRKESQTLKHSQSLQPNFTKNHEKILKLKSTMMFVPLVGYLFSCDTDSSTRYFYYNNLEKNRISKIYKQLTNEVTDENESEENTEGEEDEKTFENSKKNDITRSDNDLRIKKIVKFKLIKLKKEALTRKEPPPLLQYEALIAMLKSSKDKKITAPGSLNLVKNSNTIEADSISLASLSESPPSEFKFSDDEENLNHSINTKTNVQLVNQKLEHLKNLKKNFHSILLQDSKLNNLKEILLELKTQQEKLGAKFDSSTTSSTSFSGNSSSTSTCSSITSPLNSSSCEMKESIERLAGYLFDILKQSIKPPSGDCLLPTSNLFKSTIDSPLLNLKKPNQLAESNTLTQNFSQYTQVWNLIECTMNANLELQRQPLGVGENLNVGNKCFFNLPKEAYLTMFQEINKFASSTNQTYLIDNSINTSQLRRKHHFMVMLMSLKFKFQLFIVYLLNHKQLANWFDHINRDKNLLKTFYEFKQNFKNLANNSSGDSGMGNEFMQISTSSSTCSSSLSNSMTQNQSPLVNINESNFNVKSLSNISVFENDEYFSYFHKLLQQFNQIEIKLHTPQHNELPTKPNHPPPPPPPLLQPKPPQQQSNIQQTVKSQPPPTPNINRLKQPETKSILNRNHIPKPVLQNNPNVQNHKKSNSSLSNQQNLINHHQTGSSNHSNGGFNLKNISKRFNIKSWFTSHTHSNSNIPIPTSASHNNFASTTGTNSRLPIGIKTLAPNTSRFGNKKNTRRDSSVLKVCDGNGVLGSGVGALISNNSSNNLMKHSLSEPSLNKILDR